MDPSKFPRSEIEAHKQDLLQLMDLAWNKCDLLGLEYQKKILAQISDECGFSEEQALKQDVQDEGHPQEIHMEDFQENDLSLEMTLQMDERPCDKKLEDDIYEAFGLEIDEMFLNPPSCHDDIFSSLFCDDQVVHDDYWISFGLPIYDSS